MPYPQTMTVELTKEQEQLIEQQLASGRFRDKSEVIAKALTLLERHDAALAQVRADVEEGLGDLRAGRSRNYQSPQELAEEIKKRGRELKAQRDTAN